MARKRHPVDSWRSLAWVSWLRSATGLPADSLERELRQRAFPKITIHEKANLVRMYLAGQRVAGLSVQGHDGPSYILAGETLARGSIWHFLDPLFGLLEEIYHYSEPDIARERFLKRIVSEVRVGARRGALGRLAGGVSPRPDDPSINRFARFGRLQRIRHYMLSIDRFPTDECFSLVDQRGHMARVMGPISYESEAVCFPPQLRDLTFSLALFLEAREIEDLTRVQDTTRLVVSSLAALGDPCLRRVSTEIEDLIWTALTDEQSNSYSVWELRSYRSLNWDPVPSLNSADPDAVSRACAKARDCFRDVQFLGTSVGISSVEHHGRGSMSLFY